MANTLNTNPVRLDTFAADVTISTSRVQILSVTFMDTAAGHAVLEDRNGNIVYEARVAAGETDSQALDISTDGLVCDVSDGTYTGATLLIYLK